MRFGICNLLSSVKSKNIIIIYNNITIVYYNELLKIISNIEINQTNLTIIGLLDFFFFHNIYSTEFWLKRYNFISQRHKQGLIVEGEGGEKVQLKNVFLFHFYVYHNINKLRQYLLIIMYY